ncbi:MAG: hypothetical protein CME72_11690 [Halomonadaceae bacterium]|nr:hypothetical protein [Halomonadaceae bacterium]
MNMMLAIASMISATARDWSVPDQFSTPPPPPIPHAQGGSIKRHQRSAKKRKARRRAKRLNHF